MADEKKVREDIYQVVIPESASPLTKRTGTAFRPMSLLILEEESCYVRKDIGEGGDGAHRPSPLPVVPPGSDDCASIAYSVRAIESRDFKVRVNYLKGSPTAKNYEFDETLIEALGDGKFKAIGTGRTVIYEKATINGKECTTEIPVIIDPEVPTPEPGCSLTLSGGTIGIGEEFKVTYTDGSGRTKTGEVITVDTTYLESTGEGTYKGIKDGTTTISIEIEYEDGGKCRAEAQVVIAKDNTCTVDMKIKYQGSEVSNPVAVMVGNPIELTFTDNGEPFKFTKLTAEGLTNVNPAPATGTATVVPTMATKSGTYKIVVTNGTVTCTFDLVLEVTKYRDVPCGGFEDSKGSAFTIFHYADMPAGRYYVAYDMYGIPDDIYVFDGEPDKADSIVLHGASQVKDKEGSPFYFDYAKSKGDIYIQLNKETTTVATGYEVKLYCPGDESQAGSAVAPTPLPNPNL